MNGLFLSMNNLFRRFEAVTENGYSALLFQSKTVAEFEQKYIVRFVITAIKKIA